MANGKILKRNEQQAEQNGMRVAAQCLMPLFGAQASQKTSQRLHTIEILLQS